ncbi:MAG: hypothetical protein H7Y88_01865 [Phycisphaerales bacterium]|nr:hypothetical protein [Phycisphaerales bacterium]
MDISALNNALAETQLRALQILRRIIDDPQIPIAQLRMAAAAILRLRPLPEPKPKIDTKTETPAARPVAPPRQSQAARATTPQHGSPAPIPKSLAKILDLAASAGFTDPRPPSVKSPFPPTTPAASLLSRLGVAGPLAG